eukprot:5038843-Pyramimonas_sp.AAC.1
MPGAHGDVVDAMRVSVRVLPSMVAAAVGDDSIRDAVAAGHRCPMKSGSVVVFVLPKSLTSHRRRTNAAQPAVSVRHHDVRFVIGQHPVEFPARTSVFPSRFSCCEVNLPRI